jgi:hypothetical protein
MDSAGRESAAQLPSASTVTSDEGQRGLKLASVPAAAASLTAASLGAANAVKQAAAALPALGLPRSAPTLRAVLISAAVEACLLVFCVAAPLVSALLEERGLGVGTDYADAAVFQLRLYLPAQCAVLVLGALVQIAVLAVAAGYLQHRGTIALEVRGMLAAAESAGPASGGALPALLQGMERAIVLRVCTVFDCGARTVCNAHFGAVCRSDADVFACVAPNAISGTSHATPGGAKAGAGRGAGGKASAAGRSATALAAQPPPRQRLQCYVLNLALLAVLGVAGGMLVLVLARWSGRVSLTVWHVSVVQLSRSNSSCLYLLVYLYLFAARDGGLCRGQPGSRGGGDGAESRCARLRGR